MSQTFKVLQHTNAITTICQPLFAATQIKYFSHCVLDSNHRLSGAGTDLGLLDVYIKQKYYNYDIPNIENYNSSQYIFWDLLPLAGKTKELYCIAQQMNFGHTFTIIKQTGTIKECFNFAGDVANQELNNLYLPYSEFLEKFIHYYKGKINANKELSGIYSQNIKINKQEANYELSGNVNKIIEQFPAEKFVININQPVLSKREISCLYWLSQGKTMDQIASILHIAHRTVKSHIENVKIKLNCQTLFQLGQTYHQLELWRMLE